MAGHSKWAQIKRKKAVVDSRRGQLWTKLLKEVTVSARLGGGDADANPRLRTAVQDARNANVPNDNIDRAIKRGTGELEGVEYQEISYEGYGPGGVALFIETMTDNRNRTVGEIRHLLSKHGGSLGETGCVAWMFDKRAYYSVPGGAVDEDSMIEIALEAGAEDFSREDDAFEIYAAPENYASVAESLEDRGLEIDSRALAMVPKNSVEVSADDAPRLFRLIELLEEHDDVQNVWSNLEISPEILAIVEAS